MPSSPSKLGWRSVTQVLAQANSDRVERIKAKGKGRGGGNAPVRDGEHYPYTIEEVIQIVERARRPHLGLMENHDGRVINIRAWDFHAGLRHRNAIADFDYGSHTVPPSLFPGVPRVALVAGK